MRELRLAQPGKPSIREFVRILGFPISKNTISAMENGERVSIEQWRRIAVRLGIPVEEIYQGPDRRLIQLTEHIRQDPANQMWHERQQVGRAQGREIAAGAAESGPDLDELEDEQSQTADDPYPDLVDGMHRVIPRPEEQAYTGSRAYLPQLPPDRESRQRTVGVLSSQAMTPFELEALIFVAAVSHCIDAMGTYVLRPEDYRGRLAALHQAIDDADHYARAHWILEGDYVGAPQVAPGHLPDRRDYPRYLRAALRWLGVHGATIFNWAGVGPWWDVGLGWTEWDGDRSERSLLQRLQVLWGLTDGDVDEVRWGRRFADPQEEAGSAEGPNNGHARASD